MRQLLVLNVSLSLFGYHESTNLKGLCARPDHDDHAEREAAVYAWRNPFGAGACRDGASRSLSSPFAPGKHMNRNAKRVSWALLITVSAGWTGYRVHPRGEAGLLLPAQVIPPVEWLAGPESFSKVQNTKNSLEGLCLRLRLEAETKLASASRDSSQRRQSLEPVIGQLEDEMHEFEGTDQELEVAQDLFVAYKCTGHLDRWLDLYLQMAYEHPMHSVPVHLAQEALTLGRAAGRQKEILQVLRHLKAIPLDFEGKDKLAEVLTAAEARGELTHFEALPRQNQRGS